MDLAKNYQFEGVEEKWYEFWMSNGYFRPNESKVNNSSKNEHFCIVIPPPNVTGSLHMGHALDNTIQDIVIRFNRMRIGNTLWVPGTDHGGIATQNIVEKMLKEEGLTRGNLGREKFLERMWEWRRQTGDSILFQLRKLGCSCDWSKTRFTLDEVCSKAVYNAFKILYEKGLIYRGKRMVNWCPRCHTALADIEVEHENQQGKLWHIKYPLSDGKDFVVVATTRPETMLGDTAVAVSPKDKRYRKYVGRKVLLPLMKREIPIVADEGVDASFGTGAVKVTPAHDPLDAEIGMRHKLSAPVVIDFEGKITDDGGAYKGMDRYKAREAIVDDLQRLDLLVKEEDYSHAVGKCYRCSSAIEPLVSEQWFLNTSEMAKKSIRAVQDKKIQFFPGNWEKPYILWMENLKDWCISRQIWWGHRIPIWYCKAGSCKPVVSDVKPGKCPDCGGSDLEQDPDVLDTWFSSGLWPFSVFGWPDEVDDIKKFYPTTVLCCGHEILYLWVARMIMMGLELKGEIPFKHVNIHGIVRDMKGKKMSKSLGNVVDPLELIKEFGTDSLRFVIAQAGVLGRDMQLGRDSFTAGRNFTNKIWNVSRYVLMNVGEIKSDISANNTSALSVFDKWILSEYFVLAEKLTQMLLVYDVAGFSRMIYEFVWFKYCDWYVEISKIGLKDPAKKEATLAVLVFVLDGLLRLIHPVMPFISEEIWQKLKEMFGNKKVKVAELQAGFNDPSIMVSDWPVPGQSAGKPDPLVDLFFEMVSSIRNLRAEMKIPHEKKIELLVKTADKEKADFLMRWVDAFRLLVRVDKLTAGPDTAKPPNCAGIAASGGVEIFVPLGGIIDFEKERLRLTKEINKIEQELANVEKKLSNEQFLNKAPFEEVRKVKEKKETFFEKRDNFKKYLKILEV